MFVLPHEFRTWGPDAPVHAGSRFACRVAAPDHVRRIYRATSRVLIRSIVPVPAPWPFELAKACTTPSQRADVIRGNMTGYDPTTHMAPPDLPRVYT